MASNLLFKNCEQFTVDEFCLHSCIWYTEKNKVACCGMQFLQRNPNQPPGTVRVKKTTVNDEGEIINSVVIQDKPTKCHRAKYQA